MDHQVIITVPRSHHLERDMARQAITKVCECGVALQLLLTSLEAHLIKLYYGRCCLHVCQVFRNFVGTENSYIMPQIIFHPSASEKAEMFKYCLTATRHGSSVYLFLFLFLFFQKVLARVNSQQHTKFRNLYRRRTQKPGGTRMRPGV